MLKRIGGILLAAIMLLSLVAFGSISVQAEEETTAPVDDIMRISDACMEILKLEEGFSLKPYWDNTQYTVGYGTRCPDDMLYYYLEHGISREAAEVLLKEHLDEVETDLDRFLKKNNITLTQNEFDAVLLFSYNCGTGWCYSPSGTFYNAIKNRLTGNELVRAFALWCSAGGQIQSFLLRRRLSEANMYLNGIYDQMPPENYCYVLYDANGGVSEPRSQGYNAEWEATPFPVPTYAGHTFQGWYTERQGGEKVTKLDMSTKGKTLYAHWLDAEGNEPDKTEPTVTIQVTGSDVSMRKGPGTNYTRIGYAQKGQQLTIVETAEGTGYRWGRFTENGGGWIALLYTNYETALKEQITDKPDDNDTTEPTEPEVTEPTEPAPTEPEPTEPAPTEPEPTEPPVTEPVVPEVPKVMGTVKVQEFLRVRKGPSTGYEEVARLKPNDRVEILEQKVVGATVWGRINQGWISMDYIKLDTASGDPGNSGNTGTTVPAGKSGTIVNCTEWVRIRSGAGVDYSVAGYYYPGDKVTVTEEKTVGSIRWGKTEKGWVSMDYVQYTATGGSTGGNTGSTPAPAVKTGVIYNCSQWVRIRSGAGTSYAVAGYYYPGDKVTITEEKTVSGIKWGKTEKGWVSMDYVKLSENAPAPEKVIKTITADCLNVREKAGTGHKVVGYLYYGAQVEILETVQIGTVTWGRVSNGWISMEYTK